MTWPLAEQLKKKGLFKEQYQSQEAFDDTGVMFYPDENDLREKLGKNLVELKQLGRTLWQAIGHNDDGVGPSPDVALAKLLLKII